MHQRSVAPKVRSTENDQERSLAILVEGTGLFLALRYLGESSLNYLALLAVIRNHFTANGKSLLWPPEPAFFFTSSDPTNAGQSKFHSFLTERVGMTVVETAPKDAVCPNALLLHAPPSSSNDASGWMRFDALIAYSLGAIVGTRRVSDVVIVTDSWPLHAPMLHARDEKVNVTLAFFGRALDARYHRLIRDGLPFLDLDIHAEDLFQRTGIASAKTGSGLSGLFR